MSSIPTLSSTPDGTPVVIKRGRGDEADARRREAEVLKAAQHPGVVEVQGLRESPEGLDLELSFVSGSSLADHPPLTIGQLSKVAVGVGTTLVDLHERGIRHGDICAEHILVDHRSRTVLCGFGHAGMAADDTAPPVAADVAGLGRFLVHELERSVDQHVIEADDWAGVALAEIAEDALRCARTPGLVELAPFVDRITEVVGDDQVGRSGQTSRSVHLSALVNRLPRRGSLVGAGCVLVALAAFALRPGAEPDSGASAPRSEPVQSAPQQPTAAEQSGGAKAPESASIGPEPTLLQAVPPPTCDATAQGEFDIDGDGCPDALTIARGVIVSDHGRWSVAAEGDHVSVGDWNCDGTATPAVVVADSGAVYFFSGWSTATEQVFAQAVAVVGPTSAAAAASQCGTLHAFTGDGKVRVTPEGVQS